MVEMRQYRWKNMSDIPDPEHVHFAIRWWQELIAGIIIILFGWQAKSKGKKRSGDVVPLSEEHINNKLKICQQEIVIGMDKRLASHEEKIVSRIKELLPCHQGGGCSMHIKR